MATLLIVDDEKDTCAALVKLLSRHGHMAEAATSGRAALEYLRRLVPQAVVLDFMMPDMDGLTVLREIRKRRESTDLPVILYTAVSDPSFARFARECGATEVWVKLEMQPHEMAERIDVIARERSDLCARRTETRTESA